MFLFSFFDCIMLKNYSFLINW